jgi:hypothetical protein
MMKHLETTTDKASANGSNGLSCAGVEHSNPLRQEVSRIVRSWSTRKDPTSCVVLGSDGVLRNVSGSRDIHDAEGLSPALIEIYMKRFPGKWQKEKYEGMDGTKVPKEEWYYPKPGLWFCPPPLSEEAQREAWKSHNEWKAVEKTLQEARDSPVLDDQQKQEAEKRFEDWQKMKQEEILQRIACQKQEITTERKEKH